MDDEAVNRRNLLYGLGLTALGAAAAAWGIGLFGAGPAVAHEVVVYRSPDCACCGGWIAHLRAEGFRVTVREVDDVAPHRLRTGVPDALMSCHTAAAGGYAIEGHVPADSIRRLLAERPPVRGLAVPGKPTGAPGIADPADEPVTVVAFDDAGRSRLWAAY